MKIIGTILCKVEKYDIIEDKLIVPDYITEIADNALFGCTTLKEVILPKSIKVISSSVFKNCDSLEKITFKSSIFYTNSVEGILCFFGLKKLKSINICGVEFKNTNNLREELISNEKYNNLLKEELYDSIFNEINIYCNDSETTELVTACRKSKSMSGYVDKIANSIINFKEYNYKKGIHSLVLNVLKLYYGMDNEGKYQICMI